VPVELWFSLTDKTASNTARNKVLCADMLKTTLETDYPAHLTIDIPEKP
jgi:hypothetical protein